jgi:hypothetical protein
VHTAGPSTAFETHQYPFANIGPLVSHVFPHFAICNAAEKFAKSNDAIEKFLKSAIAVLTKHTKLDEEAVETVLQRVLDIHSSWTSVIPHRMATATDQNPSDDEGDDNWDEPDYVGVGQPLPVQTDTSVDTEGVKKPRKPAAKSRAGKSSS